MHFMNLGHSVETAARLIHAFDGRYPAADEMGLAFRRTISRMRPIALTDEGIRASFEDGRAGRFLLENGVFEFLVGVGSSDSITRVMWRGMIDDALDHIEELSPDLRRMVDLLVTDVVVVNSDSNGGGSASTIPGLVCISPGDSWTKYDWAESIVHETMHLNLFLADMVYGLYTLPAGTLAEERYQVLSAVKIGELRPLDKAFHAAVVAVPLMWMQHQRGETALVDQFTLSLRDASAGLLVKRDVFTEYGQMLVEELAAFATSIDFGYVDRSIRDIDYALYRPVSV